MKIIHIQYLSLSEYGKLRPAKNKSVFLKCLDDIVEPHYNAPAVDAISIDGPALVHMNAPLKSMRTFGDYCNQQLVDKLLSLSRMYRDLILSSTSIDLSH